MKNRTIIVLIMFFMFMSASALAQNKKYAGQTIYVLTEVENYAKGLRELSHEFTEKTGVTVEIETLSQMAAQQKVTVEATTRSDAYDLLFMEGDYIPRLAGGNFIYPIDNFLKDKDLNILDVNLDDFIPSTLQAFQYQGKQYCLPFKAATQIFYYRPDILAKFGIKEPPKTFQELLEVSRKIHTPEMPAIAMRGQAGTHNMWVFSQFLYGYGARLFKDWPSDLTPTVYSPEAVKALKIYVELMQNYSIPGAASADYNDVTIAMQQGKVIFAIEGAPLAARILDPEKSKVVGKLGFAVPPAGDKEQLPPFTSQCFAINNASKNKEAAYLFQTWSSSKDVFKKVSQMNKYVAVTRFSVWDDPEFRKKYDYDFGHGSFTQAYRDTLAVAPAWYRPAFKDWAQVRDRVGIAVQEAVVNKKTPEEALKDAQNDIKRMLKERGYKIN
jgi:ABC-type glycerol-3-phosphate transport system substrate-binding protein